MCINYNILSPQPSKPGTAIRILVNPPVELRFPSLTIGLSLGIIEECEATVDEQKD